MNPEALFAWALLVFIILSFPISLYLYGTWSHNTWAQQGVPGPHPEPFFGNLKELHKKGFYNTIPEWRKKYGRTYGIYWFRWPVLITVDPDIIKEVCIKNFNNFINRGNIMPLQRPLAYHSLINTTGDVWRRQRYTLTPTFSTSKLKQMSRFISRCCDNLINSITKTAKSGKPLEVKKTFGSYTLDVIAGTGFGLETNSLEDDTNAFLDAVVKMFAVFNKPTIARTIASIFPILEPLLLKLGFSKTAAAKESNFIEETLQNIITERKRIGKSGQVDLLQLMIDSEATGEHIRQNPSDKCLTPTEVLAEAVLLFTAGYETTGTLLQYMSYCLAMHPDVQEKLHDEVVAAIGEKDVSYASVSSVSYLDSCIFETLRMFPPAPGIGREAAETCTIKGIRINPGNMVFVSILAMTRDETFYPDPDKFDPCRFEEGGCSSHVPTLIKELPFGCGPRQCIGMRLALYEAKMAMAAVVRKVRFLRIPETPESISFTSSNLSVPENPIFVGVELRD